MDQDFEYIAQLVAEFFSQVRTRRSLSLIAEQEMTGWEVWLQIEFSYFLTNHDTQPEWWREEMLDYDKKLEDKKRFLRPDFIIRKKGWKRDSYVAIEFKQHVNAANCIANMQKDMHRVERMDHSNFSLRSYWVLGVYHRLPKPEIRSLIISALQAHEYDYDQKLVRNVVIPQTPYGYCIF